jgi:hypothetical protein
MNIFVLDKDPVKAACYACDRHCVKMILETAQMLSSCVLDRDPSASGFYKKTHFNHPCTAWARTSRQNFEWLVEHGFALGAVYNSRYKKLHKSVDVIRRAESYKHLFPCPRLTPFAQAMPDVYRGDDAVHAYRLYYAGAKHAFCTWRAPHPTPFWWETYREHVTAHQMETTNLKDDGVTEMSSLAKEIHRIATEYGLPLVKVADAVKRLGHTDGKLIYEYIHQKGFAVVRKVSDGQGGLRGMTPEEFENLFKKPQKRG